MNQWYKRDIGRGAAVFQYLRDLRELRYASDQSVAEHRLYIIAVNQISATTVVFFPPGNDVLANRFNAEPCSPLLTDDSYSQIMVEETPIMPPPQILLDRLQKPKG